MLSERGDYTIRQGGPSDVPFVFDLGRRTVDDGLSSLRNAPASNAAAAFYRSVNFALSEPHTLLIAEAGGERLGFMLGLDDAPDDATGTPQLFCVYVAVEAYARRRGIARAFFDVAEKAAQAAGIRYLSLVVSEENFAARSLYAHLGFLTERRILCKVL